MLSCVLLTKGCVKIFISHPYLMHEPVLVIIIFFFYSFLSCSGTVTCVVTTRKSDFSFWKKFFFFLNKPPKIISVKFVFQENVRFFSHLFILIFCFTCKVYHFAQVEYECHWLKFQYKMTITKFSGFLQVLAQKVCFFFFSLDLFHIIFLL